MRKIETALDIAIRAHDSVVDKAGKPYILHPLAVMMSKTPELIGVPLSPMRSFTADEMCVAILHDVFEDCEGIYVQEVYEYFAEDYPHIIDAIVALTKKKGETNDEYYERVMQNEIAHRVKLADVTHNSSYERIVCIADEDTRQRLTEKYAHAWAVLTKFDSRM